MITPDEVRGVPIFAQLAELELERLAKRSADIHLQPGEYAAHEGESRALFVLLEGEASVTKLIDGIERVVGRRMPGEIFGEVPIVLGTPLLANLRAATVTRLMRIDPREFHAVSAAAPDVAAAVGALAVDRIEGLHDIAADEPAPRAIIVGERYDSQCRALRWRLRSSISSYRPRRTPIRRRLRCGILLASCGFALGLTACNAPLALPLSHAAGQTANVRALRSSALKPGTVFVAIGDGTLPGSVVFSAPPYTSLGETRPLQSPVAVALTKDDALIVADEADAAPLSIFQPPYDGPPKTIARFSWGGGMALDKNDNIFLAQRRMPKGRSSYLKEYLAPNYARSVRFASSTDRFITSVTALPDGAIAVGSVIEGPHATWLPGSLDIYRAPFMRPTKISAPFVQAMAVVPAGLVVVVCPQCYGSASPAYLALVTPPYDSVKKVLVRLPNVTPTFIASSAAGEIFVNQGAVLYRYAPPYSKGQELSKTSGVLDGVVATGPSGELFFGSTSPPASFTILRLPAPYTGDPQLLFSTPGVPGGITVSQ